MGYEIKQQFITENRSGIALIPQGVVLHETADSGATDENEQKYFNGAYRGASAHAFADWDSVTQLIPWNERAWHAGPTANKKFIGVELCRPAEHDPVKFAEVWNRGVWLAAWLFVNILKIQKVTIDNLLSHDDCRQRFKDTSHTDPTAYLKEYGKTMTDFRSEVQAAIDYMGVKKLNWKEILRTVASNPEAWEKGINAAVAAAKADGDLGVLEIFKYLPELIEKIYKEEK
ncbi:MAG: N-acetylmuramoyl-L-alanine amidase family protein [Caulobacteraceae bacterium]